MSKNYEKDFNKKLNKRFANTYKLCNGDINKSILLLEKVSILMNTWIVGKDLMKHHCQIKTSFIAIYIWKTTHMLIKDMQKKYLKILIMETQVSITICMFRVTHYCLQMCLKTLEKHVLKFMN